MAKITLADGMVIEGTAEELRELAKAFGEVAEATEKEVPEDIDLRTKDEASEATEAPREGDYVVFDISTLDITEGKPYKITVIVGEESFKFEDDAGDERRGSVNNVVKGSYKLYRPIEGAPQVGDKILVTNAVSTGGRYGDGDILTVGKVNSVRGVRPEENINAYLRRKEFVIVERAGEEATPEETIEEGDLIRFTENFFGVKEGEIVEVVTGADIVGDIQYRDRDGVIWNAMPKRFEIVAKKSDRKDV